MDVVKIWLIILSVWVGLALLIQSASDMVFGAAMFIAMYLLPGCWFWFMAYMFVYGEFRDKGSSAPIAAFLTVSALLGWVVFSLFFGGGWEPYFSP